MIVETIANAIVSVAHGAKEYIFEFFVGSLRVFVILKSFLMGWGAAARLGV
jgi:hypothetical protein